MQLTDVTNFLGMTSTKSQEAEPPTKPVFDIVAEGEKRVFHRWTARARAPKKVFDKSVIRKLLVVVGVVGLLLIIMQEFFLILVIASLVFISYVLAATPPEEVEFEVSNHGVVYAGQFYYWNALKHYFFTQEEGQDILNVDMIASLPGRLYFTVYPGDKEKLDDVFGRYLPKLKAAPNPVSYTHLRAHET